MRLHRNGSLPTTTAPESTFTDDVQIGGYFRHDAPSRLAGASVTFPPSARTPWKVNPTGQTIIVTVGVGWAQAEAEDILEVTRVISSGSRQSRGTGKAPHPITA